MRLVALSDTHSFHSKVTVPDGDVLIFAGDFMTHGFSYGEVFSFRDWFRSQPHKHKILIAGNHDRLMELHTNLIEEFKDWHYLCDSGTTIEGVTFWGSPYTPWFNNWAFNEHNMRRHWDLIPKDTDVLITHGPAYGIRDYLNHEHLGDLCLIEAIYRIRPKHHMFGHIHNGFGHHEESGMQFHNVSICDETYKPVNPCTVIDYES
jgi:Icc-related predicted phosphoesterase